MGYAFDHLSLQEQEALCRKCGKCCHEKIRIGQLIFFTPKPCRFLSKDKSCSVYKVRHVEQWNCMDIRQTIDLEALPSDCPYIQSLPGYNAPIEGVVDHALYAKIKEGDMNAENELVEKMENMGLSHLIDQLYTTDES